MTTKEILIQEIETLPPELLTEALDLIRTIKDSYATKESEIEIEVKSTASSLLEHLKTIGKWEGDDLVECLQLVYASRGKAQFDYEIVPFTGKWL